MSHLLKHWLWILSLIRAMHGKTVVGWWVNVFAVRWFNVIVYTWSREKRWVRERNESELFYTHNCNFIPKIRDEKDKSAGVFHHAVPFCQHNKAKGTRSDYSITDRRTEKLLNCHPFQQDLLHPHAIIWLALPLYPHSILSHAPALSACNYALTDLAGTCFL